MRFICALLFGIFLWSVLCEQMALAGEFRVTPVRLTLDRSTKTGIITVTNESDAELNVQMRAFEWVQDEEGKDKYIETQEIIFFPKIMTLQKQEQRIIRAGIKIPAVKKEKTYRLFIEEIPRQKERKGVEISMVIRFGVPIFVRPLTEEAAGEIANADLSDGTVHVKVRNTGNVHFVIQSVTLTGIDASGASVFSEDLSGWYLLADVSRTYESSVPEEVCGEINALNIEVVTDKLTLDGQIEVKEGMCGK